MNSSTSIHSKAWLALFFGSMAFIVAAAILIINLTGPAMPSVVSLGVTLDLALCIPLVYYLTLCRKLNAPLITVLIIFLACIGLASLIIPAGSQFYLSQLKKLLLVTELTLLTFFFWKLRSIVILYKSLAEVSPDFIFNLRGAFHQVIGQGMASSILISEIAMFRYGIFWWSGKKETESHEPSFSVHREAGYVVIWVVMCAVIVMETILVHLLLWPWNMGFAILATVLSIYGLIFFIADLTALIKRPVTIRNHALLLRIGIRWNAEIPLSSINEIRSIKGFDKAKENETLDCSIMKDPNVVLTLKEPAVVTGLYGIRRTATRVAFNIDDFALFDRVVHQHASDAS